MKIFYKILLSITALALLTFTSCLDDEELGVEVTRYDKVPYVIDFNEIPNAGGYIQRSFKGTTDPLLSQEATFRINLSSPYPLKKDLDVTVEFDQAAADEFVANNPGWIALNPAKQDFTSLVLTIPAGKREADFNVNFFTEGLSADDQLVAAYSVTNISDPSVIVSGNFGTQYVRVVVANIYEGWYESHLLYYHPSYGTGTWPDNLYRDANYRKFLSTVSSTKSRFNFGVWSDDAWVDVQPGNSVIFTAKFSTYNVVMGNELVPGTENLTYDPLTRTFTLVYEYSGTGGNRVFYETLVWSSDQGDK